MYNIFIILFIIFCILYTLDTKPINIVIDYIGIILNIAIIIILNKYDISLISYLLIIIYASALAILFGFIIMLYKSEKRNNNNIILKDFFIPLKIIPIKKENKIISISKIFLNLNLFFIYFLIFIYFIYNIITYISNLSYNTYIVEPIYYYTNNYKVNNFIYILYYNIFNNNIYIFNIILIILILLLAFISIIFILY